MWVKKQIPVILLILVVGSLYLFTLAPDIYLEDSGELIAAAYHLGIAHPSGYPLYLLLGKLFSFLPFGTIATRLNLMSAVFGVAAAVMLYLVLNRLGKGQGWLAFSLALLFGLSRDFWSQAIIAEVYTLNAFLIALLVWVFFGWWSSPNEKYLFWLAFLSGLGMANHQLFAFVLPVVWSLVFLKTKPRQLVKLISLFLLGFSVYLYLPLRATADPVINFNEVSSFSDSVKHFLRLYYNDADVGILNKTELLVVFWQGMAANLSYLIIGAALGGVIILKKRKDIETLVLLLGAFLLSVLPPIFLRRSGYFLGAEFTYRVYYFQAYLFVVMLAFIFFDRFVRARKFIIVGVLVLVTMGAAKSFRLLDLHDSPVAAYYQKVLESFPAESIYLVVDEGYDYDSKLFIFLYLQKVRRIRPDITIVDATRILYTPEPRFFAKESLLPLPERRQKYLAYVREKFGSQKPLFTSFPVEAYAEGLRSRPTGYAVEVELDNDGQGSGHTISRISLDHPRATWDLAYQDFLAADFYQQALYAEARGDRRAATNFLVAALKVDNEANSEDYRAFRSFRQSYARGVK